MVRLGYCSMGSTEMAIAPTSVMMSEMTVEKIGRRRKKPSLISEARSGVGCCLVSMSAPYSALPGAASVLTG